MSLLPSEWIEIILSDLNGPPTGVWADYNPIYRKLEAIRKAQFHHKLMGLEDVPAAPNASGFSDLDDPKTTPLP